jgi:Na+/H+-dicarboxylate symporter
MKKLSLNKLIIVGVIAGLLFGIYFPQLALEQKLLGTIFLLLLKMIVVPLVFASIFISISGLDNLNKLKKLGLKTISLYFLTTSLAVGLSILVMNIFNIGTVVSSDGLVYNSDKISNTSFSDMIISFIPSNIFTSLSNGSMMQIIIFSLLFAVASFYIDQKQKLFLFNFFSSVNNAMLEISKWIIGLTPIGVFSLISYITAKQGIDTILNLWQYVLVVIGVLILHTLFVLPFVLYLFARINPYRYLNAIKDASIMAFSTASSIATLPVSMRVAKKNGKVSSQSAGFVLPLGATVSMDGTAAYLVIAVLYIVNISGATIGISEQIMLGVTVVMLSVGVAALPSASIIMLVIILNQLGLSVEYIAVIIAVDRVLDMARTSVNVTSDLIVAKSVDRL